MVKITKSKEKNRRYTNPEILRDYDKMKLYYITSSIREVEKYLRGEGKTYTLEEVIEHLNGLKRELNYKNVQSKNA